MRKIVSVSISVSLIVIIAPHNLSLEVETRCLILNI